MNNSISRRNLLAGAGCLGTAGLMRVLPAWAQAAAAGSPAGAPQICLSNYYLSGEGAKFDRIQYRNKHVALLRSLFGDTLDRIELRSTAPIKRTDSRRAVSQTEPEPPILAVESIWIKNLPSYAAAAQKAGDKVAAGMMGITNAKVAVQWEQLIAAQGEGRESVEQGSTCLVTLYPYTTEGKWDAKYYTETYLPLMTNAYGQRVVRRVEVCKGVSMQGGGTPAFVSAVNMYIKEDKEFIASGMQTGAVLMKEAPKYTNINPIVGSYDVFAVG
jgi:hypothetical protein